MTLSCIFNTFKSLASCVAVITADQAVRGGKVIELKKTVDAAVAKCPSVKHVFVSKRTGADVPSQSRDLPLDSVSLCAICSLRSRTLYVIYM